MGLGWGMGAALGDGSYYFGNPTAAHYTARVYDLPVLYVVLNNGGWNAMRRATRAMYPAGAAVRSNDIPLSRLETTLEFETVIEAAGGHGSRVDDPTWLPEALARAVHAVTVEGRQALLHVVCADG